MSGSYHSATSASVLKRATKSTASAPAKAARASVNGCTIFRPRRLPPELHCRATCPYCEDYQEDDETNHNWSIVWFGPYSSAKPHYECRDCNEAQGLTNGHAHSEGPRGSAVQDKSDVAGGYPRKQEKHQEDWPDTNASHGLTRFMRSPNGVGAQLKRKER